MKEYLKSNPAEGVSVAIVAEFNEEEQAEQHNVFLINFALVHQSTLSTFPELILQTAKYQFLA